MTIGRHGVVLAVVCAAVAAASAPGAAAAPAPAAATAGAAADSGLTLRGGEQGTAFRSLTVEGEDRIHVEFDRPVLALELDPEQAPGLDLGTAHDVLDRTEPDLISPLLMAARQPSPYLARPWLHQFSSGAVATFRPEVEGVERWKLVIVNSRGDSVASFTGRGRPPREIPWDGRSASGALVVEPGRTYSSVFAAHDRAGNKRHFVGPGFAVSAYRLETPRGPVMVFTGEALAGGGGGEASAPPLLLEAASWLNQWGHVSQPIRVTATARSFDEANALAGTVARNLGPLLLGNDRIQSVSAVEPDAPEQGTVMIAPLDQSAAPKPASRPSR